MPLWFAAIYRIIHKHMTPRSIKLEIGIFLAVLIALAAVWAINGYTDTWLYVTAAIIAIPVTWYSFGKKSDGQ